MSFTIICDPGVDDALAIAFLVASGMPPHEIVAVPGNAPLEATAKVAIGIAQLLGISAPVRTGADPETDGRAPGASFFGEDGFCGLARELPNSGLPPEKAQLASLAGRVLVTAPLTTVSVALDLGAVVEQVLWMGGRLPDSRAPVTRPEFNARVDPKAADTVLRSGRDVWVVPFDVTRQVYFDAEDLQLLARAGTAGQTLARASAQLLDRDGRVFPHDAVAALALLDTTLFEWRTTSLGCERDGSIVTVPISPAPEGEDVRCNVTLATSIYVDRARRQLVEALAAPLGAHGSPK